MKHDSDMHGFGLYRLTAAVPPCEVGNCIANGHYIVHALQKAAAQGSDIAVFPQLCITSASCGDLFSQTILCRAAEKQLITILKDTRSLPLTGVVGLPLRHNGQMYSAAAVFCRGKIYGFVVLAARRIWNGFADYTGIQASYRSVESALDGIPIGTQLLFEITDSFSFTVGGESVGKAPLHIEPLAQPSGWQSFAHLKQKYTLLSEEKKCCIVFVNAGWGETTTDRVYAGECGIAEAGQLLASRSGFTLGTADNPADIYTGGYSITADVDAELTAPHTDRAVYDDTLQRVYLPAPAVLAPPLRRPCNPCPFIPLSVQQNTTASDALFFNVLEMQARGLAKRMHHTGCTKTVVGISGGLDSTLALLAAVLAAQLSGHAAAQVYAVTLPGFGTTARTKSNAVRLAELLGCRTEVISIKSSLRYHFKDIGHDPDLHTVVYENAQARRRTHILMDKANQIGALLVGTGDLSEAALGWETYNGDHMSMYNVNAGIPKTLLKGCLTCCIHNPSIHVRDTAAYTRYRTILQDILDTPISPELLPPSESAQKNTIVQQTEAILGPYELHDFFLYYLLHTDFSPRKILFLAEQTFCGDSPKYTPAAVLQCLKLFYRRFFSQQFKRSCVPDGVEVGFGSFSPRGAWHMPSDISATIWLNELEKLDDL